MNNIVFTQDVPGERDWLNSQFPGFKNLETEFSGKWPGHLFSQPCDTIWEVPPESTVDVVNVNCDKYKSLYQLDLNFISHRWCEANKLLINNNIEFGSQPQAAKAQVLTFTRCGTVFLESILYGPGGYDKDRGWNKSDPTTDHAFLGGDDSVLYGLIEKSQPDIFLCYKNDWWSWATSLLICQNFDYYHYNDDVRWDQLPPFEISTKDLDMLAKKVHVNWMALCHFRTQFPHLNFYIIEFSKLIKHADLTDHQGIKYNKKNLITNYFQTQTMFEDIYLPKFRRWQHNCLGHLQTMRCQLITDFDKFIS